MSLMRGEPLVSKLATLAKFVALPGAMIAAMIYSPQQDPNKKSDSKETERNGGDVEERGAVEKEDEGGRKRRKEEKRGSSKLQGLPMESSPYLKYTDLEDYKRQGYGTQGHVAPKPNQGGGGTTGPTLAGTGLSEGQASAVDTAHRLDIP